MSGHVDEESLALYAEGELSHRRAVKVRAHLAGCADCAATVAALSEVTAQLSHVPAPPVPSAVAARLDAALSAESAHRAAAPVPAGPPRPPRRNPLWSPGALRILAATGVAVVVAGGVGYAVAQSGSSGSPSTASGAAPAASHRSAEAGPLHSAESGTGPPRNQPRLPPGAIPDVGAARVVQSGTDYRTATLGQQAKREVALSISSGAPSLSTLPTTLHACVNSVAGHHDVSLVDRARYNQQQAVIIVVASAPGTPDRVIAVTPSCTRLASATLPVNLGSGAR